MRRADGEWMSREESRRVEEGGGGGGSLSSSLMHRVARNPAADARGHECQPLRRKVSKCSACVAMLCDGYAE